MQLQLIFDEIAEQKEEQKDLRAMYKDALANADGYEECLEQAAQIREKKKAIELRVQAQLGRAYNKLVELKEEVEAEKITMTDVAINDLMNGVTVAVKDKFDNEYEPVWSVKFKKKQ